VLRTPETVAGACRILKTDAMAGLSIVLSFKAVRRESFHELCPMVPQLPADEKPASRSGQQWTVAAAAIVG